MRGRNEGGSIGELTDEGGNGRESGASGENECEGRREEGKGLRCESNENLAGFGGCSGGWGLRTGFVKYVD